MEMYSLFSKSVIRKSPYSSIQDEFDRGLNQCSHDIGHLLPAIYLPSHYLTM